MPYTLVAREEWADRPQELGLVRLHTPVEAVYFGYTNKNYSKPTSKESPGAYPNHYHTVKELQYIFRGDMFRQPDVRYNFLLGNDGHVYEGRGWKYRPYLPQKYISAPSYFNGIYITFIGDFSENPPADELFNLRSEFLADCVRRRYIRKRFVLVSMTAPWGPNLRKSTYIF